MPEIKKQEEVFVTYSSADIVKLIIADMIEQYGISVKAEDIHVSIAGGKLYDESDGWGGPSVGGKSDMKVDPVVFNGFNLKGRPV